MNSSSPLVSVIIPTRNRPALLLRAIHSALEQTVRDIEVIVVIDGEAADQSVDLMPVVYDRRLRCIALREQVGGSEARNIGIRNARSPWIALLDDDDEWLPTKLEMQLEAAKPYAQRQIVVTSQHINRSAGMADVVRPRRLPRQGEPPCEFMFDYLCYFQTSTFFCSKELMLKVPFTKELSFFQDIDWFLRVFHKSDAQLVVVAQPLSIYYVPEKRAAISSAVNWKSKINWGRANRHLMSKRAYSRFIVGSCIGAAVQDSAGLHGFGRLFYECAIMGSPTLQLLMLLCGSYFMRPSLRKKLRDLLLLRRANLQITPGQNSAS